MGASNPLPAGYGIRFGSLEFRATGNGYLMELLSPRRNPDAPTSPARCNRRSGQRSRQVRMERRGGTPQLPHVGWDWHVTAQRRSRRIHHFVNTCSGAICASTTIDCSPSASEGGRDGAITLSLRDAQRYHLCLFI